MATKKVKAKVQGTSPIDAHETFVSIGKSFSEGTDVQEKLKSLYELQLIDSQLDKIYQLRGELPAEVEGLQEKIAELESKAGLIAETISDCGRKVAEYEQQFKMCRDQAAKYQSQIDGGIGNSREFDSLTKEVENQELLAQIATKRLGETKELIEAKRAELETVNGKIEVRKDDLAAKKEELDNISVSTAIQEQQLLARRKESAEKIDARTMSAYERIRKSVRNHIAIATVYNENACGGCHSAISPQKLIEITEAKKMVICEYCGRILVNPTEQE